MVEISAAAVKALRDETGLPMMECKKALQETGGDPEAAKEWLRKHGKAKMTARLSRPTGFGRIAVYADFQAGRGAMVELQCESAPVANNEQVIQFAEALAQQLAVGPGADSPEALLEQPSPLQPGQTLQQQMDDLMNRIREVFRIPRILRVEGPCAGYAHHMGSPGVLVRVSGGTAELAKDICMHIAAMRPKVVRREDLDPALVEKERAIQAEIARQEGKPENIIQKMIEGRMKNFYAELCLLDQPFVKDDKKTVGQVVKAAGMEIQAFYRWELGKE
ncbi:MAG: translation elongation factor Ts [Thermoguttaceae bacterium]|nr:translation elongation factor Ts [Thermoguttaceae bacterium]MDW8036892.1 translation elongation factor Ts [Thermoguttaceae bacterium]